MHVSLNSTPILAVLPLDVGSVLGWPVVVFDPEPYPLEPRVKQYPVMNTSLLLDVQTGCEYYAPHTRCAQRSHICVRVMLMLCIGSIWQYYPASISLAPGAWDCKEATLTDSTISPSGHCLAFTDPSNPRRFMPRVMLRSDIDSSCQSSQAKSTQVKSSQDRPDSIVQHLYDLLLSK